MSVIKIKKHPQTGELFTTTKNPDWVKCQLVSEQLTVTDGIIAINKRVSFPLIQKKVINLDSFKNLKDESKFPIEGTIIRIVSKNPQYEGQSPVINPTTGEIKNYFQSFVFTTDLNAKDIGSPKNPIEGVPDEESKKEIKEQVTPVQNNTVENLTL